MNFFVFYIISCFAIFIFTCKILPRAKKYFLKANLFGYDINKKGTHEGEVKVPEAAGIVPATIFVVFNMLGIFNLIFYLCKN